MSKIFQLGTENALPKDLLGMASLLSNSSFETEYGFPKPLIDKSQQVDLHWKIKTKLFTDILMSEVPLKGLLFLSECGLLHHILPELERCKDTRQNPKYHPDNVMLHCMKVCSLTPRNFVLRWAGLLHDIGKYQAFRQNQDNPETITFHKHEVYSTQMARNILKRFKVFGKKAQDIQLLVSMHMYHYTGDLWGVIHHGKTIFSSLAREECESFVEARTEVYEIKIVRKGWTEKTVYRFINKMGITKDDLDNLSTIPLFQLRHADRASRGLEPITEKQKDFEQRLKKALSV